jgi:hypothetical protein
MVICAIKLAALAVCQVQAGALRGCELTHVARVSRIAIVVLSEVESVQK